MSPRLALPLILASRFAFEGFETPRADEYSRTNNPARDQLADTIAKFEGGAGAVVASAGHDAGIHFACDPRAAVADRQGPKYGGVAVSLGVELFGGVRAV